VVDGRGGYEGMRGHTRKGFLPGSEGGDKGIPLFLGWARWESWLQGWFGRGWRSDHSRRRHNLLSGMDTGKSNIQEDREEREEKREKDIFYH